MFSLVILILNMNAVGGGQPPGATPPRDDDSSVIPGNVDIDPNASSQKFPGVPDVSGDLSLFKEGTCTMHVHQWKNPKQGGGSPFDPQNPWTGPFSVEITMWDDHVAPNPGNKIGYVARTNANDPNALHMTSKLDLVLIVTPEEKHDYIQFNLGALSFTSTSNCKVGGWVSVGIDCLNRTPLIQIHVEPQLRSPDGLRVPLVSPGQTLQQF
jgi:hypothetical protein